MTNTFSKLALAVGSIALALAPVSASAGTRAGDNATVYGESAAEPGIGRSADGEQIAGASAPVYFVLALVIGAWTTAFIAKSDVLFDDDEEEEEFQSTGI